MAPKNPTIGEIFTDKSINVNPNPTGTNRNSLSIMEIPPSNIEDNSNAKSINERFKDSLHHNKNQSKNSSDDVNTLKSHLISVSYQIITFCTIPDMGISEELRKGFHNLRDAAAGVTESMANINVNDSGSGQAIYDGCAHLISSARSVVESAGSFISNVDLGPVIEGLSQAISVLVSISQGVTEILGAVVSVAGAIFAP